VLADALERTPDRVPAAIDLRFAEQVVVRYAPHDPTLSMRSNLIAGLDIGTTKTCALVAELVGEGRRRPELRVLGVGQARTGGVRRDVVTHIEETTESVRSAMPRPSSWPDTRSTASGAPLAATTSRP
jgi:hypothetical protein